jgi:hypothetical protein
MIGRQSTGVVQEMEGLLTALCDLARPHIVRGHVVTRSSTTA